MFIRPKNPRLFDQTLHVNLGVEELRELHKISRKTGKSVRRLIKEAVKVSVAEAKEAESYAF